MSTGEVDDFAERLAGGCVIHDDWQPPEKGDEAGSAGLIQHDSRVNAALRTTADGKTFFDGAISATDDPYYKELRGFLDAVTGGTEVPVTPLDGAMAVSIALAAVESAKTGKVVAPAKV